MVALSTSARYRAVRVGTQGWHRAARERACVQEARACQGTRVGRILKSSADDEEHPGIDDKSEQSHDSDNGHRSQAHDLTALPAPVRLDHGGPSYRSVLLLVSFTQQCGVDELQPKKGRTNGVITSNVSATTVTRTV